MKIIVALLFLGVVLSSCNCDDIECNGMKPIRINFDNYTFDNSDHVAVERYARGTNFTQRLSAYSVSMSESSYYNNSADLSIDLWRYDIQSPEIYDFKLILLEDSSVMYITNLEPRKTTRRSCGLIHTKEYIVGQDLCPIGYMQIKGDNVKVNDDGSILWSK